MELRADRVLVVLNQKSSKRRSCWNPRSCTSPMLSDIRRSARHRNHRGVGVGAFVRREVDVGACQFHRLAGTLHWSLRAELLDGGLNQTLAVGRVWIDGKSLQPARI